MKKKICMIVPSFTAKGGIVSVVNGYRGSKLEEQYDIHYIETYCDGGKCAKLFKAIKAYCQFAKELISFRPDLVHIHSSFGASFYRKLPFIWLASFLKIPIVNHVHGAEWQGFFERASFFGKKIKKKTYSKCNAVIALSAEWKNQLKAVVDKKKIHVICNYGPGAKESYNRENRILFMGFLCERKGCFDIPDIISLVVKRIPDAEFILAGSGKEDDVLRLESQIIERHISDHVRLAGWICTERKEKELRDAAIFFLPSYTEGMPMSILEAMGYGLPIVSSNVGGIPELVIDGKNGYLCNPGDIEAFANAIVDLLQNEKLRKCMGEESRKLVQEDFSLDKHLDSIACIYESVF